MAVYMDTSAAVKLVQSEPESMAFRSWLGDREVVSSDLLRTELLRATCRGAPALMVRARAVLETFELMELSTSVFEHAGELNPDLLRSLDSLHLACALNLGDDLEGILTYDLRLAQAAHLLGIPVFAPGAVAAA